MFNEKIKIIVKDKKEISKYCNSKNYILTKFRRSKSFLKYIMHKKVIINFDKVPSSSIFKHDIIFNNNNSINNEKSKDIVQSNYFIIYNMLFKKYCIFYKISLVYLLKKSFDRCIKIFSKYKLIDVC